ncbi:TonB-dependent receptor [Sphingopyxis panaciterrae]|uniref:TonB-dependent receptor n=1 Tax=Sphingopyxis panaciterrae TaxID=363841 RepID=UPI0014210615|nr:TonB-dependent receptor [Sphingopyxis panaciterrae]NIJ37159.1 TonB-dependent receptor [Sphingopyxis panaciterrae]
MRASQKQWLAKILVSTSALSLMGIAQAAAAQEAPADGEVNGDEIVVTGIRASLEASATIKREAQGVVDAISAEDIGKFPDTNLAESLQRITGVSIDRNNGEGSLVTVRGFGPEFNLVTVNGRQVPTATIGDGGSAPSSRSFDFANLASEGIAAVEVYKSGRATIESGGIGSTINIRTPRPLDNPGMRGSLSVKGVYDTSRNQGNPVTPEVSGIFSSTFADDTIGIMIAGSYQRRKSSTNSANVGWRDGYLGSENNWGSLAQPGSAGAANITNRPGPDDVYQVAQNASYDLNDIDRERINGQAVLQFRPSDSLTATIDYIYSRNTVETRNSNVGVWFNHGDTSSAWTDGPVAGPLFYSEKFGPPDPGCVAPSPPAPDNCQVGKDLSYSGALQENRAENKSLGFNLGWEAPGGVTIELDAHHSTAEVKPVNRFGSSMSLGNAVFGVANQTINFENDLPIISYGMHPGIDPLNTSLITPTGNAFRNAYFRNRINQVQLRGKYDHDGGFLDSIDFGVSYVDSKVRSAFGTIQNDDTWGGAGPASDIPDDIFKLVTLPDKFPGLAQDGMIQSFYSFDFERMADLVEQNYQACSNPATGVAQPGTCLAVFNTDRRISEKTIAPYLQVATEFDLFQNPAHFVAGIRYETTDIASAALVPVPVTSTWVGENEFNVVFSDESAFTRFKGSYDNWLPAFDLDISPMENVKLRASYSHTITRPDYASMQGGRTIDTLFRVGGGTGSLGNPGLIPYKSKNIDLSAEWYYGRDSYLSVGYFHKDVSNFISSTRIDYNSPGITTPVNGPRWQAALAALGADATLGEIRQYIINTFPDTVTGNTINAAPGDPLVNFEITTPVNNDRTASINGWEFAIQHSFWDTGFGVILNYTIVNGDAIYDNAKPASVTVPQFALTGLSDSANAVAYYDKNGLQARVAWNWRDKFLQSSGPNPTYIEEYWQIDASASYEFIPGITGFVEAINLTGEGRRGHMRHKNNVTFVQPGFARYAAGVRFSF